MCPYASGETVSYERDERISLRISQLVGFILHLPEFAATCILHQFSKHSSAATVNLEKGYFHAKLRPRLRSYQ